MGGYVVLRVFGTQRRGPLEWQPCRRGCQEQVSIRGMPPVEPALSLALSSKTPLFGLHLFSLPSPPRPENDSFIPKRPPDILPSCLYKVFTLNPLRATCSDQTASSSSSLGCPQRDGFCRSPSPLSPARLTPFPYGVSQLWTLHLARSWDMLISLPALDAILALQSNLATC